MTNVPLTAGELHVITGALRVAGTQYTEDAGHVRVFNHPLADLFDRQARHARQLLERLENLDD